MKKWTSVTMLSLLTVCLSGAGCSLVTVPVKTVGSVVETTVKTTGSVAEAPFKAVGGRREEKAAEKPAEEP